MRVNKNWQRQQEHNYCWYYRQSGNKFHEPENRLVHLQSRYNLQQSATRYFELIFQRRKRRRLVRS